MSDPTLNYYVGRGTTAERTAFVPNPATPAAGPALGYLWWDTDTESEWAYDFVAVAWVEFGGGNVSTSATLTADQVIVGAGGTDVDVLAAGTDGDVLTMVSGVPAWSATGGGGTVANATINGRLTTESGVPVSTGDRTAQSTIYFTPYNGNQIGLYNGSAWTIVSFSELSLALSGLTSGKNYDVFVDYNSGTPQLVLSAAWTNDTTRTDALALQDGIYVKSGTAAYRWVGTMRTTGTTTIEDSAANRFLWNSYNRVARNLLLAPTTDSWTYNSTTLRQWNASAANQVAAVVGDTTSLFDLSMTVVGSTGAGNQDASFGFGLDSTTALVAGQVSAWMNGNSSSQTVTGSYRAPIALGYHYVAALEARGTANNANITVFGDAGIAGNRVQSGITGTLWN